jgi:iron(III) transport system substrate-binding protein
MPLAACGRSRGMRRAFVAVAAGLAVLAACTSVSACGGSASGAGPLVLYNGQHEQTADNLVAAFEKKTGIKVVTVSNDEDTLADQIGEEGSHSRADVFFTENSPPLEALQAKGLLSAVDPSTLAKTPSRFNSPQGDWVGVSARVSVIIYNPSLISASELPTHVSELAEPKYAGKLALAPSETDFQPIVTAYLRAYGRAATLSWLKRIYANASGHVYGANEDIADEVNRGEVAFGVINQYYWYRLRAEDGAASMHSKITYFAPGDPGYVIDVSGAAILKSSEHQAQAQKFLAFLVSKQAQEIIATPGFGAGQSLSFEYPIASGVTTHAGEKPFSELDPYPISVAELGTGAEAIDLMRQAGLL